MTRNCVGIKSNSEPPSASPSGGLDFEATHVGDDIEAVVVIKDAEAVAVAIVSRETGSFASVTS